jgi:hypothetical protein
MSLFHCRLINFIQLITIYTVPTPISKQSDEGDSAAAIASSLSLPAAYAAAHHSAAAAAAVAASCGRPAVYAVA